MLTGPERLGHVVGAALMAATLLNGLAPFAKRVGIIERPAFDRYWAYRCGPEGIEPLWCGLGRQCVAPETSPARRPTEELPSLAAYVFAVPAHEWPLKAAKDVLLLGLIAIGLRSTLSRGSFPTVLGRARLPALLLAYVLAGAIFIGMRGDLPLSLLGLRSFSFLPIALLWVSIASPACLDTVASWCLALASVQCALMPWEILQGVTDRPAGLPFRAAGTLVHANTLGVFAVVVLAFGLSFSRSRRLIPLFWATALLLVACAGSGTGWVVLVLSGFTQWMRQARAGALTTVLSVIVLGILCIAAIPVLTGREDVLLSVDGRLNGLRQAMQGNAVVVLLGNGLGVGTNAAQSILGRFPRSLDSTVTTLLVQLGIVGLVLFSSVVVQAWYRTRSMSVFWLSITLGGLALNVLEAFPLNVLLGLCIGYSLSAEREMARP